MKLAWLTATAILLGVAVGVPIRAAVLHADHRARPATSGAAAGGAEISRLVRAAATPTGGRAVLTHRSAAGNWELAYSSSATRICWVLILPNRHSDGSCAAPSRLRRSAFVASGGTLSSRRSRAAVVYGWVWPKVKSMRLVLSDCSSLRVDLSTRPVFWRFVPEARLRHGADPLEALAVLRDGTTTRSLLAAGRRC